MKHNGLFSVSATTRAPTAKEVDGVDYHFISEDTFEQWIAENRFLEYAKVFGRNWYGTLRTPVTDALEAGRVIVLDIDVQGAEDIKRLLPEMLGVFLLPPSHEELLQRLRLRARDSEEAIEHRFAVAKSEIERAKSNGVYDAFIVNDNLQTAAAALELIVSRCIAAGSARPTSK